MKRVAKPTASVQLRSLIDCCISYWYCPFLPASKPQPASLIYIGRSKQRALEIALVDLIQQPFKPVASPPSRFVDVPHFQHSLRAMPPPERSNSYPESFYAPSDADSASILSETSTFHSMNLNGFPDSTRPGYGSPRRDNGVGGQAPSLSIDESYLSEKTLPAVPNNEHTPM
ncbi:hypothetical protein NMY22_g12047 [Coprinellus aureogranulatus]|nr:hypothetical protein NMY22_g12047 [Coprinellus aureogranulatus]